MKKAICICLVLISVCVNVIAQEKDKTDYLEGFEEYIETVMEQWKVPGLAIGIVKDGEIIYLKGFGYRDVENKLPVDAQTMFCIGSSTKAFTATAIGMLVDEKKFKWGTPIKEVLTDFQFNDSYATKHLNAEDLLLHRTGLNGHDNLKAVSSIDRDSLFKIMHYLEPNISFREDFQYANLNFVMAGNVVDKLSGDSYEQFIAKRIFEPLGMKNSTFFVDTPSKTNNVAQPYMNVDLQKANKGIPSWGVDAVLSPSYFQIYESMQSISAPAGGIYSNAEDMVEWVKLNLNKGKVQDQQIISSRNLTYIHTPFMVLRYNPNDKLSPFFAFGMGWETQPYRGYYFMQDAGQVFGYMANVSLLPYENMGVVVLTNMYYHHVCYVVTKNVYDRLLGLEINENASTEEYDGFINYAKSYEKSFIEYWLDSSEIIKPTQAFENYQGIYENPAYGEIVIDYKQGELSVIYKNKFEVPLKHYNKNIFTTVSDIMDYNRMEFTFIENQSGEIEKISVPFEPSVDPIVFTRIKDL